MESLKVGCQQNGKPWSDPERSKMCLLRGNDRAVMWKKGESCVHAS